MSYAKASKLTYDNNLTTLGYADEADPISVKIFPRDFEAKERVLNHIDAYNEQVKAAGHDEQAISYTDYMGIIPEGFDTIRLPEAEYLMFQGQPFREEDYCQAIRTVQAAMDGYDPSVVGYRWDDENPRIQLEPRGERGYIEMRAVKPRAR